MISCIDCEASQVVHSMSKLEPAEHLAHPGEYSDRLVPCTYILIVVLIVISANGGFEVISDMTYTEFDVLCSHRASSRYGGDTLYLADE